jgi:hypothetical protein
MMKQEARGLCNRVPYRVIYGAPYRGAKAASGRRVRAELFVAVETAPYNDAAWLSGEARSWTALRDVSLAHFLFSSRLSAHTSR